ncbi:serine--tRNA ligase [Palleronia sp. LCG004]|uniref:serine--tRNA ligase n=1 Tax=Palleronia sp. LCG004 TaxID=3079304 RepID=UPI0029437356|nr:serine--tRNA ligase [Palleronia sp. LCG004]WOI54859.1 serine--tRNA ligase [Palleronia sp. LCG004]
MHDIRLIRDDPAAFDAAMARRGLSDASAPILALDDRRRAAIHAAETARAAQNAASKEVGAAKAAGDEARFESLRAEVAQKKSEIAGAEAEARDLDAELGDILMGLPNVMAQDVPDGADEDDNVEIKRHGEPPVFAFTPKEHYQLDAAKGLDFEAAAKLSGSRFAVLTGEVARLHRALAQFMLDTHVTENGLLETMTPVLVRDEAMLGTGQLPKFADDSYRTTNGWWLIPTAEVTLTNLVAGETLSEADLPRRHVAHTLCFRSEAGSAGKDTAGMLRQHQFEKVEMVSIVHPDHSEDEQLRMLGLAEGILEKLGLAYRTVKLCSGDTGFGARRTYDIEVWLPGQNTYREISSISNCWDFQARRMNARFKPEGGGKPQFVHTLNGSGLAVGRALIAVLENYQREDGSIEVPEVLEPYIKGI